MTITPAVESGYTGILQEWVLTENHTGTVKSLFTESSIGSSGTWYWAQYYDGSTRNNSNHVTFDSYTTYVSSTADEASALLASSYSGLLRSKITVENSDEENFDAFRISSGSTSVNFSVTSAGLEDYAIRAIEIYDAFERRRINLGATNEDYAWGNTAVIVSPNFLDVTAPAIAAYAYAMRAPIFFTESDGFTVSEDTLARLTTFENVAVIGDEKIFSAVAFAALNIMLDDGTQAFRITGDDGSACALAIAVADEIAASGNGGTFASVVGGNDIFDALGALNLSGHEGGMTLISLCTADTKRISSYLHETRDDTDTIRLFGRDIEENNKLVSPFNLEDSISDLWGDTYVAPTIEAGDVMTLWGVDFTIAGSASSGWTITPVEGYTQEGKPTIEAGTYYYNGIAYVLSETVNPQPTYKIDLQVGTGGVVSVAGGDEAYEGDMVMIVVTPDKGYGFSSVAAIDSSENELILTYLNDYSYTFIMPANLVTVAVEFIFTDDTVPNDPDDPDDSNNPGDTDDSGDTDDPSDQDNPDEPSGTEEPNDPDDPNNSGDTGNTDDPGDTDDPSDQDNPDEPSGTEEPNESGTSSDGSDSNNGSDNDSNNSNNNNNTDSNSTASTNNRSSNNASTSAGSNLAKSDGLSKTGDDTLTWIALVVVIGVIAVVAFFCTGGRRKTETVEDQDLNGSTDV